MQGVSAKDEKLHASRLVRRARSRRKPGLLPNYDKNEDDRQSERRNSKSTRFQFRSWSSIFLRRYGRFFPVYLAAVLAVAGVVSVLSAIFRSPTQRVVSSDFSIIFPLERIQRQSSMSIPPRLHHLLRERGKEKNYGGLEIRFFERTVEQQHRVIFHDPLEDRVYKELIYNEEKEEESSMDYVYAFDDDEKRNPINAFDDDKIIEKLPKKCRRTSWHRDLPINCNNLHEFDVLHRFRSGDTKYLGEGAYREVYLAKMPQQTVVFKAYYWDADFIYEDFEYMRMDAIVAEKLTWSDKIVDIYGYCGTGMINGK